MGLPRRSVLIGVAAATVLAVGTPALAAEPVGVVRAAGGATAVPDSYIVVLKDSAVARDRVGDTAKRLSGRHGGTVARTYGAALRGFEVKVSASAAARIAADPAVAYVEQNHTVSISGTQANPPSWGLDRIDQRNLPLNSSYTYPNTASNVHAYIIDTGIRFSHNDFGGRATSGYDAVDGGSADDCNGHGTHVAGTVGGSAYGVAKAVQLVGVRVLNCSGSGTNAGVIGGVDWVTANAIKPAVANMSLGGGANSSLDNAVRNSIASGVTYGLAAGNDNGANACNTSPARTTEAITVGSTTSSDARSSFSNVGTCLDIFAPGSSITSAWYNSNTATNTISGTSMATPHVVGAAALVASANPSWTPAQVRNQLVANATPNVVGNPGSGSPNLLLYVGTGSTPPPPTGCTGTNGTDVSIPDAGSAVTSSITISGCGRNASSASTVAVNIVHTYRGDLVIDLLAPDGSSYRLKNSSTSDSADNVNATYTANVSGEAADGIWRLQVRDTYSADTGYINTWTLTV
ncbi:S8 family peptidase [Micromonospora saelicesensis]|uniref:Extracellular serine proteinase n=1 Tax=Micromonospora saelicesensis TaxID=285676 RepID=A0A1C4V5R1_9ACTN|nr:S8 family serine peptidase [Micromonospora saelicesensis]RAN97107.1 Extracellular serine proteinase [Micromonospora saelicesensis]RAO49518.1 Extracellular serine proteinase [Micromonospora saelicesensis]RAO56115.1 Extracellular serine proteinase [Micromonospora saelicesensis]RAO61235.1 Extracellular serine proteinase [Micromonospora saelicesensis]SCE79119.1 Serine protease, subtilisin family [Micromonospora saelicesensis]